MSFEVPASYHAYCTDRAIQTAVDHILSSATKDRPLALPADIHRDELRTFHLAVLSAHQVRCEYAVMLFDLWDAVWQQALEAWNFKQEIKPRSALKSEPWINQKLDTYSVWEKRRFGWAYDIVGTDHVIDPTVLVDSENVKLAISLWIQARQQEDLTAELDLGDDWTKCKIEKYDYAVTRQELVQIQDEPAIDLNQLCKAAKAALAAVQAGFRG